MESVRERSADAEPPWANYNALHPLGEGRGDCFPHYVVRTVHVGINAFLDALALVQAPAFAVAPERHLVSPFLPVHGHGVEVEERRLRRVALLDGDERYPRPFALVAQLRYKSTVGYRDERLVVDVAHASLLLPALVMADDDLVGAHTLHLAHDRLGGLMHIVVDLRVPLGGEALDALARALALGQAGPEVRQALVVVLIDRLKRTTVDD